MNDYNFGNFLCMLREQKGMTQAELAQQLSVTPAAVSKWENGESKPRIETLFQLAEILGVTAEELMAGKFLRTEEPNAEQIEAIRKRYEYQTRISTLLTTSVRIKRIVAFYLDWNLAGLPLISFCVGVIWHCFLSENPEDSEIYIYATLMMIGMLLWHTGFILRDLICKGRSVGKRIMGLTVIDEKSGEAASKKQLAFRNIFFLFQLQEIDGIIMLVRGMSIGDSVARTLVVSKKQWEELKNSPIDYSMSEANACAKSKTDVKIIVGVLVALVLGAVLFVGFIFGVIAFSFNSMKESEQYAVAYSYLVESGILEENGLNEEDLKLKSYSIRTDLNSGKGSAELGFRVGGSEVLVVCYKENEKWYVCEACSDSAMTECHKHLK